MKTRLQEYLEYLESNEWRLLREQAFIRARHKCECCDSKHHLVGHHLVYRDPLTACTPQDIMCMCKPCHDAFHRFLNKDKLKLPGDRKQTIVMTSFYVACDKEAPKIRRVRGLPRPRKVRQLTPLKKFNQLCRKAKRAKLTNNAIADLIASLQELHCQRA